MFDFKCGDWWFFQKKRLKLMERSLDRNFQDGSWSSRWRWDFGKNSCRIPMNFLLYEDVEGQDCGWNKFIINHGIVQTGRCCVVDNISGPETTGHGDGNSGVWFVQFECNERWHVVLVTLVWEHVSWPLSTRCNLDFTCIFDIDHFVPFTFNPRSFELICVSVITWERERGKKRRW